MNKLCLILAIGFFLVSKTQAQNFENYQTLLSEGEMPEDFKLLPSEKYHKELMEIRQGNSSKRDKKRKQNFALESNFALSEMMMSGRVIYGDELGSYIGKIADIVLQDNPKLRSELRFYIIKSTVANAFSTNQGLIFITSGLIAQVENEAQLAFIIAHEIVHYNKKHNYEQFKKREAILEGAGKYSTVTIEEKLRSLYKYSKQNETEADLKGMELFLKTDYNPFASISAFDVLLYSYLPYDMIEWKPDVFETEYYKFPENFSSAVLDEISADENDEDKERTHPNMGRRKDGIMNILNEEDADSSNKSLYLVSQTQFLKVQKIARFELASLYIKSGNPAKAYYIAYLLDKTYGVNTYTDKIKAMAIYSLGRHAAYGDDLDNYGCDKKAYEGEIQQVAIFFTMMKRKDISVLAAKFLWEMSAKYPQDDQLKRMRYHAFADMFIVNNLPKSGFTKFKPASLDTSLTANSKVDKLKSKQKVKEKAEKYYYAAFYELLKDKKFKDYFDEISESLAERVDDDEDADVQKIEKKSKAKKSRFTKKKHMAHDNIISVVLFKPEYNAYFNSKNSFLKDEAKQVKIAQYYKEEAKSAGIELTILDEADKDNFDTKTFNKFAQLNDWFVERVSNDTLTMELYQKEFIKDPFDDYKTKYLGWTGMRYSVNKREFNGMAMVGCIILYPLFPFYLKWQLSKDRSLESLMVIYDVETGKPVLVDYSELEKKPKRLTLKAGIYNQLHYLKNGK